MVLPGLAAAEKGKAGNGKERGREGRKLSLLGYFNPIRY